MGRPPKVRKSYSRAMRKEQIKNVLLIAVQHGDSEPKSIADIGRQIGIGRSPHLRDILFEMAEAGDLAQSWRDEEGKMGAFVYLLASSQIITEKYHRRHISVKSRGQAVGQLEMFS